jgi:hypothetical protein
LTDQERWQKVENALTGALHINGVLTLTLSTVLAILNREIPGFKDRAIAYIRQLSSSDPNGQAMVDGAVKLFAGLEDAI